MANVRNTDAAVEALYVQLGERIRHLRNEAGWTQADLSAIAGLSRASISNIEAGIQRIQLHVLLMLAKGFGMSLSELLGDNELASRPALIVAQAHVTVRNAAAELVRLAGTLETLEALDA